MPSNYDMLGMMYRQEGSDGEFATTNHDTSYLQGFAVGQLWNQLLAL